MTFDERDRDRQPVRLADRRRHGIHLRARLNECTVTLNLIWERAWHTDEFDWQALYAGDDPFRLQNMTSSLLELLHPAGRSEEEDALIALMRPRVLMLRLAAMDLSGPFISKEPLSELALRMDDDIRSVIGARPTRAESYQAACIHARRYVVYTRLDREREEPGILQAGLDAQRQAVTELRAALSGAPAYRDWARKDPAFKHLLRQGDFRRVVMDTAVPDTEPSL